MEQSESIHVLIIETVLKLFAILIGLSRFIIGTSYLIMAYVITNCITITDNTQGGVCEIVDQHRAWFIRRTTEGKRKVYYIQL